MQKSKSADSEQKAGAPKTKQAYSRPTLSRYGRVSELTTSGSNPMAELGMGMAASRRN